MDHYEKGETMEVEEESPLEGLKDVNLTDVVTMKVKHGSKVRNIMGFAMRKIKEDSTKHIIFAGCGPAVAKTITCVEIMKRKHKTLHQISKAYYKRIEEFWEPKDEGLDRLKVNRRIPAIMVLLSKEQLDTNEPGYQAPGSYDALWTEEIQKSQTKSKNTPGKRKHKQYHDKTSNGKATNKSAKGSDATTKSAKGSEEQSKKKAQKRKNKNQNIGHDKGQRQQQQQEKKKEQQ